MMDHGFSLNPGHVRADRFKRRKSGFQGKWYDTVVIDMNDLWDHSSAPEAVRAAWANWIREQTGRDPLPLPLGDEGFFLVVMHPYHRYAHPVMIEV